jgi:hypothetical protein
VPAPLLLIRREGMCAYWVVSMAFCVSAFYRSAALCFACLGFATASLASDNFSDVKIEIDAATLGKPRNDSSHTATDWIDLEAVAPKSPVTQTAGMFGIEKPIIEMPDGTMAKLHLGARAGALRAGISWNLD